MDLHKDGAACDELVASVGRQQERADHEEGQAAEPDAAKPREPLHELEHLRLLLDGHRAPERPHEESAEGDADEEEEL